MRRSGTKHIVRHMRTVVCHISKFTCIAFPCRDHEEVELLEQLNDDPLPPEMYLGQKLPHD